MLHCTSVHVHLNYIKMWIFEGVIVIFYFLAITINACVRIITKYLVFSCEHYIWKVNVLHVLFLNHEILTEMNLRIMFVL